MSIDRIPINAAARAGRFAVLLSAAIGLTACVAPASPPPRVVDTTQPSVTYEYTTDNDLVTVTRRAEDYCRQFTAWPQTRNIANNQDGSKTVAFDCNRTDPPIPPEPVVVSAHPAISYTVRSDQDLVNALRNAASYCGQKAQRADTQTISRNADGSRTVSFRCVAA